MGMAVAVNTTQIIIEMGKQPKKRGKAIQDRLNNIYKKPKEK